MHKVATIDKLLGKGSGNSNVYPLPATFKARRLADGSVAAPYSISQSSTTEYVLYTDKFGYVFSSAQKLYAPNGNSLALPNYGATYEWHYLVPGGGAINFTASGVSGDDYTGALIQNAVYQKADGSLGLGTDISFLISLSQSANGSFTTIYTVAFLTVIFVNTPYGLLPVREYFSKVPISANGNDVTYDATISGVSEVDHVEVYVATWAAETTTAYVVKEWQRLYSGNNVSHVNFTVSAPQDIAGAHLPTIFLPYRANYPEDNNAKQDYALSKTFHASTAFLALTAKLGPTPTDGIYRHKVLPAPANRVFYSETGYLGFSSSGVNYFDVDTEVNAIVQGQRGVYVFGDNSTYEVYGDLVNNIYISGVPLGVGADNTGQSVAYSGDVAYVVNKGSVYHISPGGAKNVSAELETLSYNGIKNIIYSDAIGYLVALDDNNNLLFYDSKNNVWVDTGVAVSATSGTSTIGAYGNNIFVNGSIVSVDTSLTGNGVIEYKNLDLGAPSVRKRVHKIILRKLGNWTAAPSVSIAPHGGTYKACSVIDMGETYEVRCPSVVATGIDVRIELSGDGRIGPPIVFVYEPRTPTYDKE